MNAKYYFIFLLVLCVGCTTASAGTSIVYPHTGNTYEIGCDQDFIKLVNNDTATNPTYNHLLAFLKVDQTDAKRYTNRYCCADFAETLHNNAEKAGIKCAWVGCDFTKGVGHAFNEFITTDKGAIFIDNTGYSPALKNSDSVVTAKVGKQLTEKFLFRKGTIYPMGIVKKIEVYW